MTIGVMIVTISDTRTFETDKSGQLIEDYLNESGHRIIKREIVKDDRFSIEGALTKGFEHPDIDVILTSGGTGIAYRDVTIETVEPLLDKEITGFGEIFRMLSYTEDIGSAAIMSRAIAGVAQHTAIFSMPGSSGAVKLAMEKLILPELTHVVHEIKKDL
ncbi:MAG TPA: MogA/MoaB family molybdenum cofactor biosynthesis protein [Cerasibacillus sp.]|uniref:MogA/MoaB family molybdenum cofactor biosynthesis protein n=1 Tax=Cerasibacillus sp. TaxID=2498711 RepID=UPI002F40BBE9